MIRQAVSTDHEPVTGVAPDGIEEQIDYPAVNAVYARFMPDPPPARSAPANVKLPRNLLISLDAIAVLPER